MSTRAKGLSKERTLAGILTGLGYKVQRAIPSVRFIRKGVFVSHQADLFNSVDVIAIRKGTPPLFIQAGESSNGSHKRRDMERELLPYVGPTGPVPMIFLWGRTKNDGYRWSIEVASFGSWRRIGTMKLDGTVRTKSPALRKMMKPGGSEP